MTSFCKYCDKEIFWRQTEDDKWIATDPYYNDPYSKPEWHNCSGRNDGWQSERKKCNRCFKMIYFSDQNKAPSGKYIPMDSETEKPHKCVKPPKRRSLDELFWNT